MGGWCEVRMNAAKERWGDRWDYIVLKEGRRGACKRNMCRDRILPGPRPPARLLPTSLSHRLHLPALVLPRAVSSHHCALSPTTSPLTLPSLHPLPPSNKHISPPPLSSPVMPRSSAWRPHDAQIEPRMVWSLHSVLGRTHLPVRLGTPGHPARLSSPLRGHGSPFLLPTPHCAANAPPQNPADPSVSISGAHSLSPPRVCACSAFRPATIP